MFTQVNPDRTAEGLDREVRKLLSICALHNVPFGAPQDFAGFMQKLAADRHFAMDFWSFIGTLSNREKGELSDDQMISFITETVAGGDIPEQDSHFKKLLGDMFAGVDVASPIASPSADPVAPSGDFRDALRETTSSAQHEVQAASVTPPAAVWRHQAASLRHEVAGLQNEVATPRNEAAGEPSGAVLPVGDEVRFTSTAAALASTAPAVEGATWPVKDEALQRLESKNIELQHYVDAMEAKLKRLEPRAEQPEQPPVASRVRNTATGAYEARRPMEEPELEHRPVGGVRLVLEPDLSTDAFDMHPDEHVPLSGYPQREGYGRLVALLVVLALLVGGGLFAWRRGVSFGSMYGSVMDKIHFVTAKLSPHSANPASESPTGENSPGDTAASASPSSISQPSASPSSASQLPVTPPTAAATAPATGTGNTANPQLPGTTPQPAVQSTGNTLNHTETPAQPPAPSPAGTRSPAAPSNPPSSGKVLAGRSAFVPSSSYDEVVRSEDGISNGDELNAIKVAPGVMAANLNVSRVPIYPDDARAQRIQGAVVAQALIGKDGTVEQAHAISGDPLLREAALEAVRRWRYHPYVLNGRPVAVTTTVTVDFRLNR